MGWSGRFFVCDVKASIYLAKNTDLQSVEKSYSRHAAEQTKELANLKDSLNESEFGDKVRKINYLATTLGEASITVIEDPRFLRYLHLGTDTDGYIVRKWLPKYLEENTDKGDLLWEKLIGKGDRYELRLGEKEYEMEGIENQAGFLEQKDTKELKNILGNLEYSSGEIMLENYRKNAESSHFVKYGGLERIYEMCAIASNMEETILLFEGSY